MNVNYYNSIFKALILNYFLACQIGMIKFVKAQAIENNDDNHIISLEQLPVF